MDGASNVNIETALNALQNLRREHVGASSVTSVTNPREGVASELRRAFPTLRREGGQSSSSSWRPRPRPRTSSTSSSMRRQATSSRSYTTTKPVYKDLILIPNPNTDKVPMLASPNTGVINPDKFNQTSNLTRFLAPSYCIKPR